MMPLMSPGPVGPRSRSRRRLKALLQKAGRTADVVSAVALGIGTAGLNTRGERDEDGTHTRVQLSDGSSVIYREYATSTRAADWYRRKELAVYDLLGRSGVPVPALLSTSPAGEPEPGLPPALLLDDPGGDPLELVFRSIPAGDRSDLWATAGEGLRRLHEVDPTRACFLDDPVFQRPWANVIPYFVKSFDRVRSVRPDLGPTLERFMDMRDSIQRYLDAKPRAVCVTNAGGYLPGMLVVSSPEGWTVSGWVNLGYYVSLQDPDNDVVGARVSHREWTGADLPPSFYSRYGSEPDEAALLFYEARLQLGRGAAYMSGSRRPSATPPTHSTAVAYLDRFPAAVERLASLLAG